VIIDPHSTRSAWRRFPRKRKRKKAPDLAEQWRKEENEKGGTLPPMTSQQSSLELCLATSSRVNTLGDDDIFFLSPKKSREGGRGRREWWVDGVWISPSRDREGGREGELIGVGVVLRCGRFWTGPPVILG
jgi:hypothetical protein